MTDAGGPRDTSPAERWRCVEDILAAALECNGEARRQLVAERCAGDADLAGEVVALLAAHDGAGPIDRLTDAVAPAAGWARERALGWEGRRVGQYRIEHLLGVGGMGLVHRGRDERLARSVALKFLSPVFSDNAAAKQRFLDEARVAAALDHPNVCAILEIGETGDGQLFIAMPWYDGETLRTRLNRGPLPFADAVPIAMQIARALSCAHERGIVHCDVKPSNVMVLADGTVKVLDFGIATMDSLAPVAQPAPAGTVAYMSPEQLQRDAIDHRADIWAIGILLHEMLTGVRPFDGDDRQTVARAILSAPNLVATSHPDVPAGVDRLLHRALARRPEDRHPTMEAFAAELAALQPVEGAALDRSARDEPPRGGDRRRAAVLVTMVSEYGALVEHTAPADAQRLIRHVRNAAVDVARRHGGLVNQAIGEEIVSLFGVPAAHEDDDVRSVRAAIELHARVAELPDVAARTVTVRVQSGVHVGSVVAHRLNDGRQRFAIAGAPARLASRLAASAQPGDILLSADCQRLVAPFVRTARYSGIVHEGGGDPVPAFRVTGETGLETRLEASARSGLTPFVGRASELARLQAHVDRARRGDGAHVVVVGEAGVGKSRLLHELRERALDPAGIRLLHGRCRGYEVAPYCPFIDVVRDALDLRTLARRDADEIADRIRSIDRSLARFLPLYLHLLAVPSDRHPLPSHLQGEHLHAALVDAVAAMISSLVAGSTVVVLLEDWHWADAASRATLDRMADIVTGQPVLFIVTTRPEGESRGRAQAQSARIELEPLDFAAAATMMRGALGANRVSGDLARQVFERSGGNPLFVEQICCALVEQRAVEDCDGEATLNGDATASRLPETVQAVIRTRLDALDPKACEVLRVAAVIGREFPHALLADVLDPAIDLAAAIVVLETTGLIQLTTIRPDVTYRFRHVLTHEVSYESLLVYQRTTLHERVGRAIESRQRDHVEDAAVLAHHFHCAGLWPEAIEYGRRAAERLSALSQFTDALAILDRVLGWLEQLPDDEARRDLKADVLLQYERACETLGLRRRQREVVEELIAHLSPHGRSGRLAEAYLRQGDLLTLLKRYDAADRSLATALAISRERGDARLERKTLLSVGLLRWHAGRFDEALVLAESALALDRERGDDLAVAGDLANIGNILKCMGEYAAARQRLKEALAMPALARDPKKSTYVLHNLANVHRAMGDVETAIAYQRRSYAVCRAHLLPIQRSFHLTSIAHMQLEQGHLERSVRTYEKAVALSRRARHAEGLANSLRPLGEVLFGLGREEEALPLLQEAARLFEQLEDPASEADVCSRTATILERMGRHEESLSAWTRVRSLCEQLGCAKGRLAAIEGIARALRRRDPSSGEVLLLLQSALDLAAQIGDGRRVLALRNMLGIVEWERGHYSVALEHYEAALHLVREYGNSDQEAIILNSLGVTFLKLRRSDEALKALEEGLARSRTAGDRLLEAHAISALGQLSRLVGNLGAALQHFEQSLALRRALNDRSGEAWMLGRIAETAWALGDHHAARRAAAAAAQIAHETGDAELVTACDNGSIVQ